MTHQLKTHLHLNWSFCASLKLVGEWEVNAAAMWQSGELQSVYWPCRYYSPRWGPELGCSGRSCQPDSHRHGHHQDQVTVLFFICTQLIYWWCSLCICLGRAHISIISGNCFLPVWAACSVISGSRFEPALDSERESFSSILSSPSRKDFQ